MNYKISGEQARKMNVDTLRSNQAQQNQSVEVRIAKAAITICFLFVASWTPYAVLALIGAFGDQNLLTPGKVLKNVERYLTHLPFHFRRYNDSSPVL